MSPLSVDNWNGGEYAYCYDLVNRGGDPPSVPTQGVANYLVSQITAATHDGRADVAAALENLLRIWRQAR